MPLDLRLHGAILLAVIPSWAQMGGAKNDNDAKFNRIARG
jgi:hypothetical protein